MKVIQANERSQLFLWIDNSRIQDYALAFCQNGKKLVLSNSNFSFSLPLTEAK